MDEGLNYQDQDELEDDRGGFDSSEWQMEHVSFMEREESKLLLQYQNYHLHFIRKKEAQRFRRLIPSTKLERLAFYRNYVSSPNKAIRKYFEVKGSAVICILTKFQRNRSSSFYPTMAKPKGRVKINRISFIWFYLLNIMFKSLPHVYFNVFLASYVPEQHSYIVLMSPCFHGAKFVFIASALFELINFSKNIVLLLDYVLRGIIFKNPWNRCSLKLPNTGNYTCYAAKEVAQIIGNRNLTKETIEGVPYNVVDGERFMLVQVEYFIKRYLYMHELTDRYFFFLLWLMVAILAHNIFKRNFWKLLRICHLMILLIFFITYIHTTFTHVQHYETLKRRNITVTHHSASAMYSDLDALLEVTVAPPIVHILTARSVQEIFPNRDSAIIVLSNTLFYIVRGIITARLHRHCELLTNIPFPTSFNYLTWYYLWPTYFNSFYLGDLFTLIYFILNFIVEFATFMVAFQCLVEFMGVEWMYFNRLFLTIATTSMGVITYAAFPMDMDYISLFSKLAVNIIECLVINLMYPFSRMIDDMTFHYGVSPSKLRVSSLRFVVVAASIIFYVCISCIIKDRTDDTRRDFDAEYVVLFSLPIILIVGFFYTVFRYLVQKKVSFRTIFVPEESWGPNDYNLRQLRKQFDSRFYIGSQAPRPLSRYLMTMGESKCYHLDLRYDSDRRSTIATSEYRKENEKKAL